MPMPKDGSHSTFWSNAISVPGRRQTATYGSPTAAKPRVMELENLVTTSLSSTLAGRLPTMGRLIVTHRRDSFSCEKPGCLSALNKRNVVPTCHQCRHFITQDLPRVTPDRTR